MEKEISICYRPVNGVSLWYAGRPLKEGIDYEVIMEDTQSNKFRIKLLKDCSGGT